MNEPIKAGDKCIIIKALFHSNIGKIVTAGKLLKELDPPFGKIIYIHGQGLRTVKGIKDSGASPIKWLKKITPPKPKPEFEMKKEDLLNALEDYKKEERRIMAEILEKNLGDKIRL